jgi:hypothetical protein
MSNRLSVWLPTLEWQARMVLARKIASCPIQA